MNSPSRKRIDTIERELYSCFARYARPILIAAKVKIMVSKEIVTMYDTLYSHCGNVSDLVLL